MERKVERESKQEKQSGHQVQVNRKNTLSMFGTLVS